MQEEKSKHINRLKDIYSDLGITDIEKFAVVTNTTTVYHGISPEEEAVTEGIHRNLMGSLTTLEQYSNTIRLLKFLTDDLES